jgi:hypothetical protein
MTTDGENPRRVAAASETTETTCMNLHPSDITKLVKRGIAPNHPNFANEAVRIQRDRKIQESEDLQRRIFHQTKGIGFTLEAQWNDPRKWARETQARCPMWLGATTRIELWTRGEDPATKRVALLSEPGNPNKSSLFEVSADMKNWRRIL